MIVLLDLYMPDQVMGKKERAIKYIIIDDDEFARDTLEDLLTRFENLQLVKKVDNAATAIKYIYTIKPDIVFLDINMPGKTGLDILSEIKELGLNVKTILVTAHENHMLEAFKRDATDYLVKPVCPNELKEVIERLIRETHPPRHLNGENCLSKKLTIKNAHGSVLIDLSEIMFVEADGCYTTIHLDCCNHVISRNIGKIEPLLPKDQFFRISRSCIVNHQFVSKIDRIRRQIVVSTNGRHIKLKAAKEKLYDFEAELFSAQN